MSKQGSDARAATFPFGSYDIFSYLIPGATSILGIINFEHWFRKKDEAEIIATPVWSTLVEPAIEMLNSDNANGGGTVFAIAYAAAVLCVIYVSGHVVSSISSFFLDRIYVAKAQGYPYEVLLRLPRASGRGFRPGTSKGFYQGAFFWINLYLVLRFTSFFYSYIWLPYCLGLIEIILFAAVASKLITTIYRGNRKILFWGTLSETSLLKIFADAYLERIFPTPFSLIAKSIESHVKTSREFGDELKAKYRSHFYSRFKLEPESAGTDNFWFCKMYVAMRSPIFDRNLTYWMEMYTYARNLATAFYATFFYCFWFVYLQLSRPSRLSCHDLNLLFSIPLGYFLLAGVLAIRFRYIYVGYYNRFLYRAFMFLCEVQRLPDPPGESNIEPDQGTGNWPASLI